MRKIFYFIIFIISLNITYANCQSIEIGAQYIGNKINCSNLNRISIIDNLCQDAPPPGNCWQDYKKVELILPKKIIVEEDDEKYLKTSIKSYDWTPITCTEPGIYEVKVIFDDGECVKTLTLNLTEPKEETEIPPEPPAASRSPSAALASEAKEIKETNTVPSSILITIISIAALTALFLVYLILRRK